MKLWGMVLEVAPQRLTISLPHGLRGTVEPKEVRLGEISQGEWGARVGGGGRWGAGQTIGGGEVGGN